jgi:hypothetical protein
MGQYRAGGGLMIDSARFTSRRKISERKIAGFERKYRTTLAQLRQDGLSDDASMEMHEDFVEWSGWQCTREEAVSLLATGEPRTIG